MSLPNPRTARLTAGLDQSMRLMEIGASYNPLLRKSDGWNIVVVDHDTREALMAKYRQQGVAALQVDAMEEVDIVWSGGSLHRLAEQKHYGQFDAIIASHVMEHMPDPIAFLLSCRILLKPTGRLILALPDKRYCFDYFRPISMTGDLLYAHHLRARAHTPKTAYEGAAYAAKKGPTAIGWGAQPVDDLGLVHVLDVAYERFKAAILRPPDEYADFHAWAFVPSSFSLIILELGQLGVIDLRPSKVSSAVGLEFYAELSQGVEEFPTAEALQKRRLHLLTSMLLDVREQTEWLLKSNVMAESVRIPT